MWLPQEACLFFRWTFACTQCDTQCVMRERTLKIYKLRATVFVISFRTSKIAGCGHSIEVHSPDFQQSVLGYRSFSNSLDIRRNVQFSVFYITKGGAYQFLGLSDGQLNSNDSSSQKSYFERAPCKTQRSKRLWRKLFVVNPNLRVFITNCSWSH